MRFRVATALALALLCAAGTGVSCRLVDGLTGTNSAPRLKRKWFTAIPGSFEWVGLPAVADGVVITGMFGGLAGFDTATGEERWHAMVFGSSRARAAAVNNPVHEHTACIADYDGIGCVDTRTGSVIWNVTPPTDSATEGGSSAVDAGSIYYGTRAHRVQARALTGGALRWSTDLAPEAPFLTRVFGAVVRNDTVYATTVRWLNSNGFLVTGDLVAVDANTGKEFWRYTPPAGEKSGFQLPAVLVGNLAILSDVYRHALRAIDITTQTEVWQSPQDASGYINAEAPPIVLGDTVFVGSSDTQLYSLDLKTGTRLWRSAPIGGSLGGVAVCGSSIVTVPLAGGDPYTVDRSGHSVLRARLLEAGDYLFSQPAVSGATLYASGELGIYAFACE